MTPIGKKVKEIMNSGELVADEITIALLREEVEKGYSGFLFDERFSYCSSNWNATMMKS